MTDRLSIYNGALRKCGERRIARLTVEEEPRRLMDNAFDAGAIIECLEANQWNWASRVQQLIASASIAPQVGFLYAFERPSDFVRLVGLSADARFHRPLTEYESAGELYFADLDEIFVRYISKDAAFGLDFSIWPPSFTEYVEWHFAAEIIPHLKGSSRTIEDIEEGRANALSRASSIDAQAGPSKRPPRGDWARARHAGHYSESASRRDTGGLV